MKKQKVGPFDKETIKMYHDKYNMMKEEGLI
jgi:hypothetical protein